MNALAWVPLMAAVWLLVLSAWLPLWIVGVGALALLTPFAYGVVAYHVHIKRLVRREGIRAANRAAMRKLKGY